MPGPKTQLGSIGFCAVNYHRSQLFILRNFRNRASFQGPGDPQCRPGRPSGWKSPMSTWPAIEGFSLSRRIEYAYQASPYGT